MRIVSGISVLVLLPALAALGQNATGSLAGKVIDATGASIPKARIKLTPESDGIDGFEDVANESGEFSFTDLPAAAYTIESWVPGFVSFSVKSVRIGGGAKTTLPPFMLQVGGSGRCGRRPPDHRVSQDNQGLGSVSGKVHVHDASSASPPLVRATVKICADNGDCSETTTNRDGEFVFAGLHAGIVSLQIVAKGYYAFHESGFNAEEGWDLNYGSLDIYRCRDRACTPVPLNKSKVTVCQ